MGKQARYRLHPNVLLRPAGDDPGTVFLVNFNKPSVVKMEGPVALMLQLLKQERTMSELFPKKKNAILKKAFDGFRSRGIVVEV